MTTRDGERALGRPTRARSLLIWRAMRWRAGSSAMLLAVAVAAVVAATVGPIYLRAADQSLVTAVLDKASVVTTGVALTPASSGYLDPSLLRAAGEGVPGGAGGPGKRFEAPVVGIAAQVGTFDRYAERPATMQLVSLSGECHDLSFVRGRCPSAPDEIALSTRTARALRLGVGGRFTAAARKKSLPPLVVSGLFAPGNPDASVWWGNNYFAQGSGSSVKSLTLDSGFMSEAGAARISGQTLASDWVDLSLRPGSISATEVPAVQTQLASWETRVQTAVGLVARSQLPTVLAAASSAEHSAQTVIAMVSLELILLVLLVVYSVARATSALREPDVRVAELRGLPRRRIVRVALREPAILLVAAVPIGLVLTYLVLSVVDRDVLGPASATGFDSLAIEAAVVGSIAGLVSTALGSRNILGNRRPDETAEAIRQRHGRHAAILDALGLALAVAGVVELVSQSHHDGAPVSPIGYLAPGLLALGAGILMGRFVPAAAVLAARALAWSRRAALTLAARNLARRQGLARQVLVPTIATGLLVFAVAGLNVAAGNHAMQAAFSLGAPVVLDVQPRAGVNLLDAVRAADPTGHEAMAAAKITASNGETVAVDSARLAGIVSWPATLSSVSASQAARELMPPIPPARFLPNASTVELTIDATTALAPGPDLQMALFDENGEGEFDADLGAVRGGLHTYSASISGLCRSGCRIDQLLLGWSGPARRTPRAKARAERAAAAGFALRIVSIAVTRRPGSGPVPVAAGLSKAGYWMGSPAAAATTGVGGLRIDADLVSSLGSPTVAPVDAPTALPSIATADLVALDGTPSNPDGIVAVGLDGSEINARATTIVPALPGAGGDATLIDLSFAERAQQGQQQGVTWQVWCHDPPSPALLRRLEDEGVSVLSTHTASSVLAGIDRSGPAFGFDLYGLAAIGAAVLALFALLSGVASDARRRRIEFAGLSAVGMPRATLLGSLLAESTVLAVVGAVAGTAAAAVSASFALRFLPEFPPGRIGPALQVGVPWLDVIATGLAMLVALEVAAVVAAVVLMRGIRPDLLRLSR